jgi:hypothetical protein
MSPHDALMGAGIAFKNQLLEYLEEFDPWNRERVRERIDQLLYECAMMPDEQDD